MYVDWPYFLPQGEKTVHFCYFSLAILQVFVEYRVDSLDVIVSSQEDRGKMMVVVVPGYDLVTGCPLSDD